MSARTTRYTNSAANTATLVALPNNKDEATVVVVNDSVKPPGDTIKAASPKPQMKYFIFHLKNKPPESIEGKEAADEFKLIYAPMIIRVSSYARKDLWKSNQAKSLKAFKETKPVVATPVKSKQDAEANQMLARLGAGVHFDTFFGSFLTNSRASECCLLIRATGFKGEDHWCWKPDMMSEIIKSYYDVNTPTDVSLNEAFRNLTFAPFPSSTDKKLPKVFSYSPKGSQRSFDLTVHTAYTFFTIPIAEMNSMAEEDAWITNKATLVLEGVKYAMTQEAFKTVLTAVNQGFAGRAFDTTKPSNLPRFLSKAVVKVSKVDHVSKYVVQDAVEIITSRLFDTRTVECKYNSCMFQDANDQDELGQVESDEDESSDN